MAAVVLAALIVALSIPSILWRDREAAPAEAPQQGQAHEAEDRAGEAPPFWGSPVSASSLFSAVDLRKVLPPAGPALILGPQAFEAVLTDRRAFSVSDPRFPVAAYAQRVQFVNQYPELPTGCESVALTIVLRSMGFAVEKTAIADSFLTYSEDDFVNGFVGDPRTEEGMTVYPPGIVAAANRFLESRSSDIQARDISGTPWDELLLFPKKGYPVLVWTTIDGTMPGFTGIELDGWNWYEREHCVVLYGIDRGAGQVLISDPTHGDVRHDIEDFRALFEACGSMAVVLY